MNDWGKEEEAKKKGRKRGGDPLKWRVGYILGSVGCVALRRGLIGLSRRRGEQLSYRVDFVLTVICILNQCCSFFYVSFIFLFFVVLWCVYTDVLRQSPLRHDMILSYCDYVLLLL